MEACASMSWTPWPCPQRAHICHGLSTNETDREQSPRGSNPRNPAENATRRNEKDRTSLGQIPPSPPYRAGDFLFRRFRSGLIPFGSVSVRVRCGHGRGQGFSRNCRRGSAGPTGQERGGLRRIDNDPSNLRVVVARGGPTLCPRNVAGARFPRSSVSADLQRVVDSIGDERSLTKRPLIDLRVRHSGGGWLAHDGRDCGDR